MRIKPHLYTAKIACIILAFVPFSCIKEDHGVSVVPVIKFEGTEIHKNIDGKDSGITIFVHYLDGDGDIGLSDSDTFPPFDYGSPFNHNMPIDIWYEEADTFRLLLDPQTNDPLVYHERIPVITPEGKNKTITGTIAVHLPANPLNLQPVAMKFDIRLIDRALNISNTISTPRLELKH